MTINERLAALANHAREERENATTLLPVTAQPVPAPTPEKPARKSQPKRTLKTLEERPVTNDVGYKTDHMNRAFDIVCYSWNGSVRPMQKGSLSVMQRTSLWQRFGSVLNASASRPKTPSGSLSRTPCRCPAKRVGAVSMLTLATFPSS